MTIYHTSCWATRPSAVFPRPFTISAHTALNHYHFLNFTATQAVEEVFFLGFMYPRCEAPE